jgi:uroporphyrinogen decarboxylase
MVESHAHAGSPLMSKPTLRNDLFLRAFTNEKLPRPPVWLMRQAGRYLPEYRATRSKAGSFLDLCRSPSFCAEVLLQPLERFDLDAAILFSDILTVPDAMGLGLTFGVGEGPRFARPLCDEAAVNALAVPDMNALQYVFDAVAECKRALTANGVQRVPLIGFSGSPFTLACYMIEGGGSGDGFPLTRRMMLQRPELFQRVLDVNVAAVTGYLAGQVDTGADTLMLFDTWGGVLSPRLYREMSLAPMQRIVASLRAKYPAIPVMIFSRGAAHSVAAMAASGAQGLGVDWQSDLADARTAAGSNVTLQGNFDPLLLTTDEATIRRELTKSLADFDPHHRYVANLGHGITPDAEPALVEALVQSLREL